MKFSAPLLLALAAATFAMGLKADQVEEASVLCQTKGMSNNDYMSYSRKVSECCDLVGSSSSLVVSLVHEGWRYGIVLVP
jgi:hypothetical protein